MTSSVDLSIFIIFCMSFYSIFVIYETCATDLPSELLHRSRRQLLFPNSTLLQLNGGVGTPSPRDKVFVNWAFQANFQLPWNRSQIPIDVLETDAAYLGTSRRRRDLEGSSEYENDGRLFHFYKYVEGLLNGFGYNGSACVLQTLCQLGAEPLHSDDEEDLLHELASFVLYPNNDLEYTAYKEESHPFIAAFESGNELENCTALYPNCTLSLIDLFSKPYINT